MGYNDSWAMGRPQTQLRCPQMDSTRSQFLALCQLWKDRFCRHTTAWASRPNSSLGAHTLNWQGFLASPTYESNRQRPTFVS